MLMTNKKYEVGDTVRYETFTGELRTVRVTDKLDDIKNGRPGFDGLEVSSSRSKHRSSLQQQIVSEDTRVWGYDSQIIRVFKVKDGRWQ